MGSRDQALGTGTNDYQILNTLVAGGNYGSKRFL